jgi:hypothetical protein
MKPILLIIPLMAAFTRATLYNATYDANYDDSGSWTRDSAPACANKLANSYPYFHSFPIFPNIGGSTLVTTSNIGGDAQCGSCWRLTYTTSSGPANGNLKTTSIDVTVINYDPSAQPGTNEFILSREAFDALVDPDCEGEVAWNILVNAEPINGTACFPSS